MPIKVPPFTQLQLPTIPIKGNWRRQPYNADMRTPQQDMLASFEIDWLVTPPGATCVQVAVSGNSPVALAQIAAMVVDNSRCGSDVSFIFPDTGFELVVPAGSPGGVFPVFTNALTFFVNAPNALSGDSTIFLVCNTVPPPLAQLPALAQQGAFGAAAQTLVNGMNVAMVPAGVSGTLKGFSIAFQCTTAMNFTWQLMDNAGVGGNILYNAPLAMTAGTMAQVTSPPNLNVRFKNGLNFQVPGTVVGAGTVTPNVYFTVP